MAAGPSHASMSIDWYASHARRFSGSASFLSHGSGSIIVTARGRLRPFMVRNSSTLSSMALSEPSLSITGKTRCRSSPMTGLNSSGSRAWIQFTLPRRVLISPLWTM